MATIISNDVETRDEYTATAGQTTFPYTFWAKEEDHIDVYVNGVLKTLTTDYTVGAVEVDGGDDIVFNSGLSLDDAVVITLNPDIERLADYQTSGNLKATTLNTELAYITSLFQYINTKIGRGLSLAETTTGVTSVEIAPAASKLIGWAADATSLTNYSIGDISTSIDTVFSGLASGDYIQYDGTNWVNKTNAEIKTDLGLKLNNYIATSAPTVNDDSDDGYDVGSKWIDTTNDNVYHCVDASVGAAVWVLGDLEASDLGSAAAATLIDDDTMATATSSNVASAESIKAYVDTEVAGVATGITDYGSTATTSGSSVSVASSITSGTRVIHITLDNVSVTGTNISIGLRLGDSGGIETTGYSSEALHIGGSSFTSTTQMQLNDTGFDATDFLTGNLTLTYSGSGFVYTLGGTLRRSGGVAQTYLINGQITLDSALTDITLICASGSFDAGSVGAVGLE